MLEVADIVREVEPAFLQANASRLSPAQRKAIRDILDCRTAALGGHLEGCDHCEAKRYSYHSCRNRHCPKCQGERTRRWLDTQRSRLLPVPHFLLTFTLPSELRPLARSHPRVVYGILMTAAAQALAKLAADPQFVGADLGIMAVLHTWTRAMLYHPHVHFLVTAGGLSPDRRRWLFPKNPAFLVPGYALSVIFRAKVRDALKRAGLLVNTSAAIWGKSKPWVVHVKHAGSGDKVLDYLARYVFRIAITNSRIETIADGQVTFRYRDNRTGEIQRCTLAAGDFIDRFLLHVLPRGFTKVRYYGLYAPSRQADLAHALGLLAARARVETATTTATDGATGPKTEAAAPCPVCHVGRMHVIETIPRSRNREPP